MNDKKNILIIVLLAGLVLVSPQIIRYLNGNTYAINGETYESMRLQEQNNHKYDYLEGRNIPFNILNILSVNEYTSEILFNITPIILGIISVALAYLILKNHGINEKTNMTILILLIVSPIFLYTFIDYKNYPFIIFFNILGMYFLSKSQTLPSSIFFGIVPLIDAWSGIITLILLLTYKITNTSKKTHINMVMIAIASSSIVSIILSIYNNYNILRLVELDIHNILTDIGSNIGFSFAIIILTTIGLILLWERGVHTLITYILLISMIVLGLFNDTIRIYLNFIIVIYAGFAFIHLNKRKWSISIIKKTTVLLIICSIFFSSLVYITKTVRSDPDSNYIEALLAVQKQAIPGETILSHPNSGYMIEYYTNITVFSDHTTKNYDSQKYKLVETLASSRNLIKTEEILKKYNIRYIIIDKEFKSYLQEYEGLTYIIETSGKFTQIYESEGVNIWMYTAG
jgi:hypothetical protein